MKKKEQTIDITGNKYGKLLVLGFHHCENGRSYWTCECECGRIVILRKSHFAYKYSKQKSCGCLRDSLSSERMKERHRLNRLKKEIRR